MRVTKKQIAVIMLLNLVIAALIGTVVLLSRPTADASGPVKDDPNTDVITVPHNKFRDASSGLVKQISRETRLMGSGDESVVFTHMSGGVTYVFGNATVGDLDFDKSGGFVCRLDGKGKILGFTYLSGKLTAAGVIEGGFGAATSGESNTLYLIDGDGNITGSLGLDDPAVKIMSVSSKRMAVVTSPERALKLTEYEYGGGTWTAGNNTRISDWLAIDFFDCYYLGDGYIISARAHDGRYDAMAFYSFKAGGGAVPHYNGGADDAAIVPYAVCPYDDGFMTVCAYRGQAAIVTVDYTFTRFGREMLGGDCDGGSLTYSSGVYYACFTYNGAVSAYAVEGATRRKVSAEQPIAFALNMDDPLLVTVGQNVGITSGTQVKINLDIKNASISRAFKTGYNSVLLVLTADGGGAVTSPSGGRDAYIIEVVI